MDYEGRRRNAEKYLNALGIGELKYHPESRLLISKRATEPSRAIGIRTFSLPQKRHYAGIVYDIKEDGYVATGNKATMSHAEVKMHLGRLTNKQVIVVEPVRYTGTPKADKIKTDKAGKRRKILESLAEGE